MKRSITLLSLSFGLAFGEPSAEALKAADEFAAVMGFKGQMESGFDAMLPMVDEQAKQLNLTPSQSANLREIYRAWYREDFDHDGLAKKLVRLYAETFTAEELNELTTFYKTPLGRKTLEALPAIMAESARLGMKEGQEKQDALLKRLETFLEEIKK